jgi:hypothetical protein
MIYLKQIFMLGIIIFVSGNLFSQRIDTVYADYKYLMGDNDTKSDAKRICFIEAKRLCLEKAGTYVESNVKVENYQVTKDEIKTYSASILQVEIVEEETKIIGESMAIAMQVMAVVDLDFLDEQLKLIQINSDMKSTIDEEKKQEEDLEEKVRTLQKRLVNADPEKVKKIRNELKQAFNDIDDFEKIRTAFQTKTRAAFEKIRIGMSVSEVINKAGKPFKRLNFNGEQRLNYGKIWVVFSNGKVACMVKAPHFANNKRCRNYSRSQKVIRR